MPAMASRLQQAGLVVGAGPRGSRVAGRVARLREQRGEGADAFAISSDPRPLADASPAGTHRLGQGDSPDAAARSLDAAAVALSSSTLCDDPSLPLVLVVDAGDRDGVAVAVDTLSRRPQPSRSAAIVCKPCGFEQRGHSPSFYADGALGSNATLLALADMDILVANDGTLPADKARHLADGSLATAALSSLALLSPAVPFQALETHSTHCGVVCRPGWSDTGIGCRPSLRDALHGPFTPRGRRISSIAAALGGQPLGEMVDDHDESNLLANSAATADASLLSVGAGAMLAPSEAVTLANVTNDPAPSGNLDPVNGDASHSRKSQRQRAQMSKIAGGSTSASSVIAISPGSNGHSDSKRVAERVASGDSASVDDGKRKSDRMEGEKDSAAATGEVPTSTEENQRHNYWMKRLGFTSPESSRNPEEDAGALVDEEEKENEDEDGEIDESDERSESVWERALKVVAEDRKQQVRNANARANASLGRGMNARAR